MNRVLTLCVFIALVTAISLPAYSAEKEEFHDVSQGLTASEWLNKAKTLRNWGEGGTYGDPQKAIEYLSNAIELQPDYANAYILRGIAYDDLYQYQRAIEDFNKFIRLNPEKADGYFLRGTVYGKGLDQYQRAIEDFNKAIHLNPDFDGAYSHRGAMYLLQGNNNLGCSDVQKGCGLGSCNALKWAQREGYCPSYGSPAPQPQGRTIVSPQERERQESEYRQRREQQESEHRQRQQEHDLRELRRQQQEQERDLRELRERPGRW